MKSLHAYAFAISVALVGAIPGSAHADAPPRKTEWLDASLSAHVGLTAIGVSGWLFTEIAKPLIGPTTCSWCDRDAKGNDTLNGFDAAIRSALRWRNTSAADTGSSALAFGIAPAGALTGIIVAAAYDHRMREALGDVLAVTEATALAMDVDQLTKFAVARDRPFRHADPLAASSRDDHLSFFSGHSTFTFALAASSGTVASMHKYRLAPVIWASGMAVAATTAYFRVAADKHYATDVLVGALVGTSIGALVPLAFHRSQTIALGGSASSTGMSVSVTGVF